MFRFSHHTHCCLQSVKLARRVVINSVAFIDSKLCKLPSNLTVSQNCVLFSSLNIKQSQQCCKFSLLKQKLSLNGHAYVGGDVLFACRQHKRLFSSSLSSEDDKHPNRTDAEAIELLKEIEADFKEELDNSLSDSTSISSDYEIDNRLRPEKDLEIEDVEDFGNIKQSSVEPAWEPSISLIRGLSGVFELHELCTVLEDENAKDLCVIDIPAEAQFADHMVIVSGMSRRHLRAMLGRIQWIHKRKKSRWDASIRVEGLESDTWFAMDLGNIILHIFMPETRELYDLETLWTVGAKYDDNCQEKENPYVLSDADLLMMEFKERNPEQKHK
ncbi:uncharacterized protein LOC121387660 [Gigantopelta aegis]|uniref:uncharacterized protein LOC121387660 n=1 Tax=Gigantopelta aegis TaxID=1735272 RepID=UPI001B88D740|nr:uncharacterized protein LOC121387660 [Gigantopelta aegis]